MGERFYWLAFSAMAGVGPVRFQSLLKRFGSAKEAWRASLRDVYEVLGEKTGEKLEGFRKTFLIEKYVREMEKKQVSFWTLEDEEYPKLLKEIKNPPFVLYICGSKEILKPIRKTQGRQVQDDPSTDSTSSLQAGLGQAIAVVGTRKITNYGREVTRMLVSELVSNGFTIVSGLAFGIDACAHETAIEFSGKTIAVLGCGVDCCYPSANQRLYDRIINGGGLVVSEFPLSATPTKGSFPSRNRIIAGLSLGVLVTEGAEDSGSLITADYAFKFDRKVFAVPGPITSGLSKGPHRLIEKGAKLVTRGEDILDEFKMQKLKGKRVRFASTNQNSKAKDGTKEERRILEILENEELHIDEIVRRSGLPTSEVGSLLSMMEVKGLVRNVGGGVFGISS